MLVKILIMITTFFILINNVACMHEENISKSKIILENNTWKLIRYGYIDEELNILSKNKSSSLFFDAKNREVNGSILCNSFKSSYIISENKLSLNMVAPTELYCGEDEEDVEQFIVTALSSSDRYEIKEQQLIIYSVESAKLVYIIDLNFTE